MTQQKTMVRDLTRGNVTKQLVLFALPLFFSSLLQAVYNVVDMVVVGQWIGGAGMSAVSIGGDVLHLLTFVAMGFSSAGQVIISQYVGAKRLDDVRKTIGTMFTFLLIVSLTISVLCFIFRHPILQSLNTPEESYAYTMDYVVVCISGLVFIYGYNIVSAILRGMGDSRRPFLFVGIAAILNTILDLLFVCVLDMEALGAGLATVIGQAASFIISLVYLYRKRESFGFDFKLKSFRIDRKCLRPIIVLGVPMAIQSASVNISRIILTAWINDCGVVFSAASGIYNKVGLIGGMTANSISTAGSAMIGQSLGAKVYDRVPKILKNVIILGAGIGTFFSVILLLWSSQLFTLFTADEAVLLVAPLTIFPQILSFYGAGSRSFGFALINGSGNSKLNLAVALIDGMIARVGLAALLGFVFGLSCQGFWLGDAIAGFMPFVIGLVFFLSGKWKNPRKGITSGK